MKNKTIVYVILAILIGVILGKNIYDGYAKEIESTFSEKETKEVYLIQYGVYSSNESMLENTKKLKNYFYYEEDDKFYVLIGITSDNELKEKIINSYDLDTDVYMKQIKTDNTTFLETLKQYDKLISSTDDKNTIITAEKQVLSKYDELILRSESNVN